ncbi:MAG TPA: M90 family metallopeptidase [Rhodocyclaceae bacterium]|nr:M90 family metallopeptidase [Rhodocyclaceae bacterium]
MPLLFVSGFALLFILWLLGQPLLVAHRRRKLRSQAFPDAWREILRRRVPYFRLLPPDLQIQLKKHIQVFIAEKAFVGCADLIITDEMRVTIAAQACLLLLNRTRGYYRNLRQILVYPGAFIVNRIHTDGIGVLQEQRQILSGESWTQGQVILSWDDVVEGANVIDDGRNVVIHEFAHQLDQEKGHANGAPFLARGGNYKRWSRVFNEEFAKLKEQARNAQPSRLNHYGATNPAEFFAVASEVFFEQPHDMATQLPGLYRELSDFYRVNPLSW